VSDEPRVVFTFPKNSREEVRATLTVFRGHRLADLRVWRADAEDTDHPTKRGIAVRVEDLPRLLEAVQALVAAAAEHEKAA
jgi:Transcriptional Coactivator p15 (PC4)